MKIWLFFVKYCKTPNKNISEVKQIQFQFSKLFKTLILSKISIQQRTLHRIMVAISTTFTYMPCGTNFNKLCSFQRQTDIMGTLFCILAQLGTFANKVKISKGTTLPSIYYPTLDEDSKQGE